jgi:hypothetical protein
MKVRARLLCSGTALLIACGGSSGTPARPPATPPPVTPIVADAAPAQPGPQPALPPDAASAPDAALPAAGDAAPSPPSSGGPGPKVDRTSPMSYYLVFKASAADPAATRLLGDEQAFLDTRVEPQGKLVIHLHGSGEKTLCGYTEHGKMLASFGFHVFTPCYDASVSWSDPSCGAAIGDCRLEMLDGSDHSAHLTVNRADSIEGRVVKALAYLAKMNPQGDWGYFLDGDQPRWSSIIISGQSFGATTAPLIAHYRPVVRSVSLSGPLDNGAAWQKAASMTPLDRFYFFSHVNDGQHPSHMSSMAAMNIPGMPVNVETSMPPYANSHRLVGSLTTFNGMRIDGHNATEARMQSPQDAATGKYLYEPVWRYLYGVPAAP